MSGTPRLELTIGIAVRSMQLEDVWDDDRGLVFRYQVQAEDRDDNGISVAADALKLDGATIQDSGGNDAELDLGEHAISNDGDHKVDGSIDNPPVGELPCCAVVTGHRAATLTAVVKPSRQKSCSARQ